ncbi:DUF2970 domain-containing protein [Rheinheimera sp. MMS21-TC3]|uniref:DUF2970 domain-containing protein n=1 Tax=Rheinheimera sp. MMS21-TC3 TaxID=3072790 RepID=UPI0028C3771B|nr:DUF2970 domain-containing protein [Rheinheimera sp. MMS21-TC3]WNO60495.1 DUF2970 domain-containing protein [Rheinheimera sp. MMS21-TC3]
MTKKSNPKFLKVLKAVFGALIGVQSEQQREHDFTDKNPIPYIITAVILTVLFVFTLLLIINWVLS